MPVKHNSAFHGGEQARLLNWLIDIWMGGHHNVIHILVMLFKVLFALFADVGLDLLHKLVQLLWLSQTKSIFMQHSH